MDDRLTERQKRIMLLAARSYGGNLGQAAKEDRLFGMALKHCLAPLIARHYSVAEDGAPMLTAAGYTAIELSAPTVPGETKADAVPGKQRTMRAGTKLDTVVHMLRSPEGTTIDAIVAATGWKPHTVRAVISRTVQKELGISINICWEPGKPRQYRAKA